MKFYFLIFLSFCLFSCKNIKVIAPLHTTFVSPPIKQPLSSLNIPVEIEMKSYLKMTEETLPKKFEGAIEQCEGVSFSYIFIRDPIDFNFKTTYIDFEVDGKFELKLNYCPKCHELWDNTGNCTVPRIYASCGSGKEAMRRVKVAYGTKISLGENYRFNALTELKKFEVIDPCKITLFKYDATPELEKQVSAQLIALEDDIDKQIESIDIKSSINEAWEELQKPLPISNYGFLYIQPKTIGVSELKFNNTKANLDLHLSVLPFVSTESTIKKEILLPRLDDFKGKPGFSLVLDVKASYDSLSAFLNAQYKNEELDFNGKVIKVKELGISGAQDQKLVFKLDFEGYKKGTVYLSGTPFLDTLLQKVSMRNLDFDVQTKSVLLKTAKWMFNKKILAEIEKNSVFELGEILKVAKKNIEESINSEIAKGIKLSGKINLAELKELYLDKGHLSLRTKITGSLKIKME